MRFSITAKIGRRMQISGRDMVYFEVSATFGVATPLVGWTGAAATTFAPSTSF
jgi:hypothetical protein